MTPQTPTVTFGAIIRTTRARQRGATRRQKRNASRFSASASTVFIAAPSQCYLLECYLVASSQHTRRLYPLEERDSLAAHHPPARPSTLRIQQLQTHKRGIFIYAKRHFTGRNRPQDFAHDGRANETGHAVEMGKDNRLRSDAKRILPGDFIANQPKVDAERLPRHRHRPRATACHHCALLIRRANNLPGRRASQRLDGVLWVAARKVEKVRAMQRLNHSGIGGVGGVEQHCRADVLHAKSGEVTLTHRIPARRTLRLKPAGGRQERHTGGGWPAQRLE